MTIYGRTYHPGDQHSKYSEPVVLGQNEPMLVPPKELVIMEPEVFERLKNQAAKSARRRKANRDQHAAYIRLKAENASLRERLDRAVDRVLVLELREAINATV